MMMFSTLGGGVIFDRRGDGTGSNLLIKHLRPPIEAPDLRKQLEAGLAQHFARRFDAAANAYQQVLAIDPGNGDGLHLLGMVFLASGQTGRDIRLLRRAVTAAPTMPTFHSDLGWALYGRGDRAESLRCYRTAISVQPDLTEPNNNLALWHKRYSAPTQAAAQLRRTVRIKPDLVEANNNLGNLLSQPQEANERCFFLRTALVLRPEFSEAHNNLGVACYDQNRLQPGETMLRRALALNPDYAEAHNNLGTHLREQYRLKEAESHFMEAVRLDPAYPDAHVNLAILRLLTGRWEQGWADYEWRLAGKDGLQSPVGIARWDGTDLRGRRILLTAEQGRGDAIQFGRYAALVKAMGGKVLLEVDRPMIALMSGFDGVDHILAHGDPRPPYDLQCPLMSLPLAMGTRIETIPAMARPLRADPRRTDEWRHRIGMSGFRIGIIWQGSPTYPEDRNRSAPLRCFAPLAHLPGVRLISLQKMHGLEQLASLPDGMVVEQLGPDFDSGPDAFLDSAAVMMSLDLVISIDSAVNHLAGALGRPSWLALPLIPHWVWLLDREDSPWYPSIRLFRQRSRGDWADVFDNMAAALRPLLYRSSIAERQ